MQFNNCMNPVGLQYFEREIRRGQIFPRRIVVNCGKCDLCVASWRSRWCTQLSLEALYCKNQCSFLTLTYDEENLVRVGNVPSMDDHQKFLKRLRTRLDRLGYGKVKFLVVSEKGKRNTCRIHYHYIVFGLGFGAFEKKIIKECWTFGFIKLKPVSSKSMSYVMKYAMKDTKKIVDGIKHIFTYSRGIGFGFQYVRDNRDFFLNQANFNKSMVVVIGGVKRFLSKNLVKQVFAGDLEGYKAYYARVFERVEKDHLKKQKLLGLCDNDYKLHFHNSLKQKVINMYFRSVMYEKRRN